MYLNLYDLNLNRVGSLQTWISMTWEENYNDIGSITLEVVQTEDTVSLVKPWRYCTIDQSDQVMLLLSVQIEEGHLIAYGKSAICLLERRISTTKVSNQNAESALLGLVDGMETWTNLVSGERKGLSDTFTSQISGGSVYSYFEKIGKAVDMGYKVLKVGYKGNLTDENNVDLIAHTGDPLQVFTLDKELTVVCYKPPVNSNAKYSLNYGNLSEVKYSLSDMQYYNVALVAGQGEGDDRVMVYAGNTEATGTDRIELYVDARDLQQDETKGETLEEYKARLVARGEEKLLEQAQINNIEFLIDTTRASLGDVVSVRLPEFGITKKVRVTSRTITSEYNEIKTTLGVGEPIL